MSVRPPSDCQNGNFKIETSLIRSDAFSPAVDEEELCEHANAIRKLRKRTIQSIIEIGRRLTAAKKVVGHGRWLPWLQQEFGWSDRTAKNFLNIFEMAELGKMEKFSTLNIPVSSLYLLAAPGTPSELREEVLQQAADG